MIIEIDWDAEARRALELTEGRMFEAHRGAMLWHGPTNTMLLFSNAGLPHEQIELVRRRCEDAGFSVRGVAVTEDDYSFAMLVECTDDFFLADMIWDVWWEVAGVEQSESTATLRSVQQTVADDRIARHFLERENNWDLDEH